MFDSETPEVSEQPPDPVPVASSTEVIVPEIQEEQERILELIRT